MIRLAHQSDSEAAVAVVKAVYDEYGFTWDEGDYHADLYDLAGHYLDLGHPFFIAEHEGRVVGTVATTLFSRLPGAPGEIVESEGKRRVAGADCSMERLYVHPDARKLGLGRKLAHQSIQAALVQGKTTMELWSDKRFTQAHALYRSLGAYIVGDRICDDPDVSPEWGLLLPLNN